MKAVTILQYVMALAVMPFFEQRGPHRRLQRPHPLWPQMMRFCIMIDMFTQSPLILK